MPTARLRTGEIVEVPAGLDVGGARQYLLEHGASYAAVGLPPPEAAGAPPGAAALNPWGELASAGSPLMADILAGARGYASERAPGMTPQASPDTLGGAIGRAAIPVGVSLALPGAGLAGIGLQGAAAAGLEALRTGATAGDVVEAGAFGGAGAGLGSMASRLVTGIGRLVSAARKPQYLPTTSRFLRTMAQTGGTANVVDNLNRKALAASVARSFGQEADNLGPDVLLAGAEDLAAGFQRVIPKGAVIDLAGALQALAGVGKLGPKLTSLLPDNPTAASGTEWQDLRRAVQERASAARGSDNVLAEDLTAVQDLMDDAAESALGPTFRTDFRQLREQWKNLKVAEELGSIKGGGEYPTPAALSQKLASKYGTTYLRDAGGVLPETQALFSQARQAARDNLGQVPNSGTATRSAQLAGAGGVLGLVTGQTTPEAAALGAALAAGSALAAPASVGREVTGALAAGAGAAGQAREVLERGRPQRRRGER